MKLSQQEVQDYVNASTRRCGHPSSEADRGFHVIKVTGEPRHVPTGSCVHCGTSYRTVLLEQPDEDSPPPRFYGTPAEARVGETLRGHQ